MPGIDTHIDTFNSTVSIDGTQINGIDTASIPFPKGKTATKDVSSLNSGVVIKKGLKMFDPGSCSLSGNIIAGDAGQIALRAAFQDRKEHIFTINIPDAGEIYTYTAYVSTNFPESKDNTYLFSIDLEVTGQPTVAVTTAAITSITCAGAGVAYSPTNASSALAATDNVVVIKEATGISTDTVTVTASASSYIGLSVNGGTTWATLTSGVASSTAVTLGAAGTLTPAIVRVEEALKAARFVRLYFARA